MLTAAPLYCGHADSCTSVLWTCGQLHLYTTDTPADTYLYYGQYRQLHLCITDTPTAALLYYRHADSCTSVIRAHRQLYLCYGHTDSCSSVLRACVHMNICITDMPTASPLCYGHADNCTSVLWTGLADYRHAVAC